MTRAVERMLAQLDADRQAILRADFNALDGAESRLQHALQALGRDGPERADLDLIVTAAQRNLALIGAARDGFLTTVPGGRVDAALTTYGPNGKAQSLSRPATTHDLRR